MKNNKSKKKFDILESFLCCFEGAKKENVRKWLSNIDIKVKQEMTEQLENSIVNLFKET